MLDADRVSGCYLTKIMSGHSHDTSSQAQPKATIRAVYKRVWEEYYEWDTTYTSSNLLLTTTQTEEKKAKRTSHFRLHSITPSNESSSWPLPDATADNACTTADNEAFTLHRFADDGSQALEEVVGADVLTLTEFAPCPEYEACTPMPANILQGEDSTDMPFIPYADDPKFDAAENCEDYDRFAWQVINADPDCESFCFGA